MEQITKLKQEILDLKNQISEKEKKITVLLAETNATPETVSNHLSNDEIGRYSRQIIIPEIGVKGQLKLKNSAVLVVGAGGLGCPALLYLAAAGIGQLGIVDYDDVEINNLHRQTLHTELSIGKAKVASAKNALEKINSKCLVNVYNCTATADEENSILTIIRDYNAVVDCSDNVATRYLLNDACVLLEKPLVSGSALKV